LPPTTARVGLTIPVVAAAPGSDGVVGGASGDDEDTIGDGGRFERWLRERGLFFTLIAVAFLGLGLNLTPCVYPLISVTVAFFGGQSHGRAAQARLAVAYVLGIALSFSVLGVVAAFSGGLFGAALQRPAVLLVIATVLVVLALSSFGLYQLRLPSVAMRWAGRAAHGVAGALFMGLTMGVVAAPCVGPVVIGLLLFVGSRQDMVLGFVLFFVLALGMGAPYLVLAMVAGSLQRLPRSGEWLLWTERIFGCVLLAMAAYFISLTLPEPAHSLLVPAVIAVSGIYLGFIARAGQSLRPLLTRGLGTVFIAVAVWLGLPTGPHHTIAWAPLDHTPLAGAALDKPMLIDFAAEWCIPCREMDRTTYVHPEVLREAERFRMVKADITQENEATTRVVERFQVRGVPTIILFSRTGDERRRFVGYVGVDEMLEAMRQVE
jgi:thiol:disulfide interchange protein DsbD